MEKMSKTHEEFKTFPEIAYLDPDTCKELKKILGFELYALEETKELLRSDGYTHSAKRLCRSASEWIQQLERDKAWASENYDLIREENKHLEAQNSELLEKIKRLERERDALLAIVKEYGDCEFCKHGCPPEKEEYLFDFCMDCDVENCRCLGCTTKNNHWEWRGPCEENGGSDA